MQDDGDLVRKARVVADAVGDGGRQQLAVPVFVLQALAVERGAAAGAAEQKAARLHIARRPGQVADALEAKHRVVDVERHHDAVVGAVRCGRRDPARHAAGFIDALLQNLAGLVFAVVHHLVFVHRGVELALGVVDADLAKQPLHAEGARFINQNRHHARPQRRVAQQLREKAHIGLGGGNFAPLGGGLQHRLEGFQRRHGELLAAALAPLGQVAAQRLAALVQVAHLGRVVGRFVKGNLGQLAVGDGDVEAIPEGADVFVAELFGLVRGVFALARLAHAVALDGFHQQHRRLALVVLGAVKGGIDLGGVVAAPAQRRHVGVAHLGHQLQRARVTAKEVFAHKGAVVGLEGLVVAVERVHHDAAQRAVFVARQQLVPLAAPEQLDHVPARAAEFALQLLDDLAVATHRAIEALQVAVDDEDQVVQPFARRQPDRAQAFGLVHFAVAAKGPDLALGGVGNAARMQILEKTRLVDRHQGPQPHAHGRELPKTGHELGVRVARQALAIDFLAEVEQLLLADAPFHVGARVDAGRAVALHIEQVAAVAAAGVGVVGMPKVVKARRQHVRHRLKGADVAAQVAAVGRVEPVGFDHHRHGVPAHVGAQPPLQRQLAGAGGFFARLDGVDVAGGGRKRQIDTVLARFFEQLLKQKVGALRAFALDHRRQGVEPFTGFLGVEVGRAEHALGEREIGHGRSPGCRGRRCAPSLGSTTGFMVAQDFTTVFEVWHSFFQFSRCKLTFCIMK